MYENKGKDTGWINSLFDHSIMHAMFTFLILTIFSIIKNIPPESNIIWIWILTLFDFSTHFVTDRWKATRKTDPSQSRFWKSLGIDQMIHHIVGIFIIWTILQG